MNQPSGSGTATTTFTHSTPLPLPVERLDVSTWLFQMTDTDYADVSRAHRALGTWQRDGRRGMVNVESIGGALMVQHYEQESGDRQQVVMVSPTSSMYLGNALTFRVGVRWTMEVTPDRADDATFSCTVQMTMRPSLLRLCNLLGMQRSAQRHVDEETVGYAHDLARYARTCSLRGLP